VTIRSATPADFHLILELLRSADLPTTGVEKHLNNFLVAASDGRIIGCVGLEVHGEAGLLRSLVVKPEFQHQGVGRRLCEEVLRLFRGMRLKEVYLLTTTAQGYFERLGFQKVERELVDEGVKRSDEFSAVCPETATCMRLPL